jgi:predicted DNA-binding protein (MmcQ/YjbR family)
MPTQRGHPHRRVSALSSCADSRRIDAGELTTDSRPNDPVIAQGHTGVMTRDEVLAICLDLPAAEETYPFGEEVAVMKIGGKMFALVPLSEGSGSVNLKCDPARALELREAYTGIRPGYHQNKRHWNTVDLDGSVEDDVVRGLIEDSYLLVVAGLPRALRAELARD